MKLGAYLARSGAVLVVTLGVVLTLNNGQASASGAPAAMAEIHAPAERTATTGSPFLFDGRYYGWTAPNWSGYAAVSGPYTAVTGSWTVPAVAPSKNATYSSAWTGIDGFDNAFLIQTGTDQDSLHGKTIYFPWWTTNEEGFLAQTTWTSLTCVSPCSVTPTTFTVSPGDSMTASVAKTGTNLWAITLTDTTSGVGGSETNISHTASAGSSGGDSAEWIMERPASVTSNGKFHFVTLADYGTTAFDLSTANGSNPGLVANSTSSDAGIMLQGPAKVISIPSVPDSDTDGFNISYGSTAPSAP